MIQPEDGKNSNDGMLHRSRIRQLTEDTSVYVPTQSGVGTWERRSQTTDNIGLISEDAVECSCPEEAEVRRRLRWFFSGPFEKYYMRQLRPWKLFIQILKIIFISIQVLTLWVSNSNYFTFFDDLKNLSTATFLDKSLMKKDSLTLYNDKDLKQQIHFAYSRYSQIDNFSFYIFQFPREKQFEMCVRTETAESEQVFTKSEQTLHNVCQKILSMQHLDEFLEKGIPWDKFRTVVNIQARFNLMAELKWKKFSTPQTRRYMINFTIDHSNLYNNGQVNVQLQMSSIPLTEQLYLKVTTSLVLTTILNSAILLLTSASMIACTKSFIKHFLLFNMVKRYFIKSRNHTLTLSDKTIFINWWIVFVFVGDVISIVGTASKIKSDFCDVRISQGAIILLAISCIASWIGALRYLAFFESYNALLVIIQLSSPTLCRFLVCVAFLFIGFTFFGYILLAPYHEKFRSLSTSAECLFSLMNGDEIFITFQNVQTESKLVKFFSQLYLAVFNLIFIYFVVTIFIAIVCHYHECHIEGTPPTNKNSALIDFVNKCDCFNCALNNGQWRRVDHIQQQRSIYDIFTGSSSDQTGGHE